MKNVILLLIMLATAITCHAQNVGINNTNPDRPLTIRATGANHNLLSLRDTSNTTLWHLNFINDGLNFARTGFADGRLFLGRNGNLGIGTTNPLEPLSVFSNIRSETLASFTKSGNENAKVKISNSDGETELGVASGGFVGTTNDMSFYLRTNRQIRVAIGGITGNVGIGTTAPETSLAVNGAISTTSQTININGPSATVNAGNRSYIRIKNTGIAQTIITMADGLSDGQLLVIVAQSSGGGAVQFIDAAANNTQLNSSYAMGIDDTLTLIWDATLSKWIELHRSVN